MSRRVLMPLLPVVALAVSLTPALVPVAAAADAGPRVTLRVSAAEVTAGDPVRVTGRVRGPARRVTVVLQRRTADGWTRVARTRARTGSPYSLRTRVPEGTHRLRVRVPRKAKRALVSTPVRVRGLAPAPPSAPPPTAVPPSTPATELTRVRELVLEQTNALRATQGLAPLKPMAGLDLVAQQWTAHMAATGDFRHNPQFSAQYPAGWRRAGENIAYGYAPERVVQGWTDSAGHRANMLGDYTHLGVGFARDANGRPYYTQNFARY